VSGFGDPPPDLDRPGFGTPAGPDPAPAAPGSPPAPGSPAAPPAPAAPSSSPAPLSPASVLITVHVNGEPRHGDVEPRTLLSDFLRHDLGLTGTKVGCEQGWCGACTVQLDGEPVRSCLTFAVQADGAQVKTIEGLEDGRLQRAFHEHHALQCGYCTAGLLMTLDAYLAEHPEPSEDELKVALAGNICRCTGYAPIIKAVRSR
jgi:aerobic-type carbon monoxide dehydrogenase small subunit (CoxS/CutS family)